ncbi:hypothetical protein H4R99_001635 [Coemansia sp. RSA 1722]|nr:hypothetical protein LPJ57_001791 [Coemansia sp. RSA 486]KAJ2234443.1 hypothetical protein IWW45_003415 [Coemansia sp. RSA 485]KAJ2604712.1 hypothetical protein H4R99_001635 [Coemansia sp. RSA 1722]
MRIPSLVAAAYMAAVSHSAPLYYQPNGVFMPISLSVPAVIQQQQPQQLQQQAVPVQAQINPGTSSPAASNPSPWSLISASLFNQKKDQQAAPGSKAPAQANPKDDPVAMLTQILKPLKFVAVSFLSGLESQLEKADPKNVANVLQGPMSDLKNHLKSTWPTAPSGDTPPSTKIKAPATAHPAQQSVVAKSASFYGH